MDEHQKNIEDILDFIDFALEKTNDFD